MRSTTSALKMWLRKKPPITIDGREVWVQKTRNDYQHSISGWGGDFLAKWIDKAAQDALIAAKFEAQYVRDQLLDSRSGFELALLSEDDVTKTLEQEIGILIEVLAQTLLDMRTGAAVPAFPVENAGSSPAFDLGAFRNMGLAVLIGRGLLGNHHFGSALANGVRDKLCGEIEVVRAIDTDKLLGGSFHAIQHLVGQGRTEGEFTALVSALGGITCKAGLFLVRPGEPAVEEIGQQTERRKIPSPPLQERQTTTEEVAAINATIFDNLVAPATRLLEEHEVQPDVVICCVPGQIDSKGIVFAGGEAQLAYNLFRNEQYMGRATVIPGREIASRLGNHLGNEAAVLTLNDAVTIGPGLYTIEKVRETLAAGGLVGGIGGGYGPFGIVAGPSNLIRTSPG
ncbi:MAG: hypothetical protein HQ596_08350 [Candidatus Saganbacteria bacterium]|nr:hypothetical protein [Candidatus Saganbacteria bacterium]